MTILSLRPSEIRYSQDSIAYYFGYGRYSGTQIGQTLDDLLQGKCNVRDIPTITVSSRDGLWYSGDNRRLWVFRKCEELSIIDTIPVQEGYISCSKFTTYNRGVSIRVRGSPGGRLWTQRHRIDLVIKKPEPPKPVEPPESVIAITPYTDCVVQRNINISDIQLSVESTDIADDSNQSLESDPSQKGDLSEENDLNIRNISADVENTTQAGQVNPSFVEDEDDPNQQNVTGSMDIDAEEDSTDQTTPDVSVHSDNGYRSVDSPSSEGSPIPCDQPEDVQHDLPLDIDTHNSTVGAEPVGSVDVELGLKVGDLSQPSKSVNCFTFLSKYRCQCLILLTIAVVLLIVLSIALLVPS